MMRRRPRIGLALGAGGVLGGAWLAGGLAAISRTTGWEPGDADYVIGTSAGSLFAALTAAHLPTGEMLPATAGAIGDLDVHSAKDWVLGELAMEAAYRIPRSLPHVLPGSLGMLRQGFRGGGAMRAINGLIPAGNVSTRPIENAVRRTVPNGWVRHPNCWVVACDYETGERTVFGRTGSPEGSLADCVAASCAIPGFFKPVRIAGRLYVDGGLHSMSNLDVLLGEHLDLVIVLNPLSARHGLSSWNPLSRVAAAIRSLATHQLDAEVELLVRDGTDVVVIEPTVGDLATMGHNVMDARRSQRVAALALQTVQAQLEQPEVKELLARLPRSAAARKRTSRLAGILRRSGITAAASV